MIIRKHVLGLAVVTVALTLPIISSFTGDQLIHMHATAYTGGDRSVNSYLTQMKANYAARVSDLKSDKGTRIINVSDTQTGRQLLFKPKATADYIGFDGVVFKPAIQMSLSKVRTMLNLSSDASAQGFM